MRRRRRGVELSIRQDAEGEGTWHCASTAALQGALSSPPTFAAMRGILLLDVAFAQSRRLPDVWLEESETRIGRPNVAFQVKPFFCFCGRADLPMYRYKRKKETAYAFYTALLSLKDLSRSQGR